MSKLISVGFIRLRKSHAFPISLGLLLAYGAVNIMGAVESRRLSGIGYPFEIYFFDYAPMMAFVMAVFVGMFLGTEYSDGTIRNKLIVGHGRGAVYLSNFLVCSAGGILMCLVYLPVMILAGIWFVWWHFPDHIEGILLQFALSLFIIVAYAAVYTLIAMLVSSKSTAIVAGIVAAVVMMMLADHADSRLSAYAFGMEMVISADGSMDFREGEPNPNYISDKNTRALYEFAYDVNPVGQALQLANQDTELDMERMYRWPFLAAAVTVAVTGAGVFLFGKKDIK